MFTPNSPAIAANNNKNQSYTRSSSLISAPFDCEKSQSIGICQKYYSFRFLSTGNFNSSSIFCMKWLAPHTHTYTSLEYVCTDSRRKSLLHSIFSIFSHFHLLIFSREMISILARRAICVQWNAVHGNDGKNTGRTMDITVDSAVAIHVVIISRLKCTPCVSIEIVSYYA